MSDEQKFEVRDLRDGDWYWVDKKILSAYGRTLGSSGIAVYNALAFFADSQTQRCFPAHKSIAGLLGISRRTVIRKLKLLKKLGLIRAKKRKNSCLYLLLEPKPDVTNGTQPCDKRDTADVTGRNTNYNYITRNINNIDNKDFLNFNDNTFKRFKPRNREELLALYLAEALNERQNLPLYLSFSKKYPESFLRKVLGEVKEIPSEKIKKSRAALFNHLIKRYVQKTSYSLRD